MPNGQISTADLLKQVQGQSTTDLLKQVTIPTGKTFAQEQMETQVQPQDQQRIAQAGREAGGPIAAALRGFGGAVTFDQLHKIVPKLEAGAESLISGAPFKKKLGQKEEEFAEKGEALRTAYPKLTSISQMLPFFTPSAPQALAFRGGKKLVPRVLKEVPKLKEAKTLKDVLQIGARRGAGGVIETGAGMGALRAAETGGDREEIVKGVTTGSLIGGLLSGGTRMLLGTSSMAMKGLGKRIETVLVKPGVKGERRGFDIEKVFTEGVGGTLKQTIRKIESKFKNLKARKDKIMASEVGQKPVSTEKLIFDVNKEIGINPDVIIGREDKVAKAFDYWFDRLAQEGDVMTIKRAQQLKEAIGKFSKKAFDRLKQGQGLDPSTEARVYVGQIIDLKLKDIINAAAPEMKIINKSFSNLIPIQEVTKKRLSQKEGNAIIGLLSSVAIGGGGAFGLFTYGLSPKILIPAAGAWGVKTALESGQVARGAHFLGRQVAREVPEVVGRGTRGGLADLFGGL